MRKADNPQSNLVILTNYPAEKSLTAIAGDYLSFWPNQEESFQDFCRKVELFAQQSELPEGSLGEFWSKQVLPEQPKEFLSLYSSALELVWQKYFFPPKGETSDFSGLKKAIYGLPFIEEKGEGFTRLVFRVPQGFPFLLPLQYTCRRLNEKQIILASRRYWFEAAVI